jgi:hypothetical protein
MPSKFLLCLVGSGLPANRQEKRLQGKLRTRVTGAISGPDPGDPTARFASVYAGSRNSYRASPCGLLPLLVNGKSSISTVFFVFLRVFLGFWRFSTTFAAIFAVHLRGSP